MLLKALRSLLSRQVRSRVFPVHMAASIFRTFETLHYSRYSYSTSSNTDYEIDAITLHRKSVVHDNPEDGVPFRTSLEHSEVHAYDPNVVDWAFLEFMLSRGSELEGAQEATAEFATRYGSELSTLTDFVRLSYANKIKDIGQWTTVEICNVLFIFRDLYRKGKIPGADSANSSRLDAMVESFLTLLSVSKPSNAVPLAVGHLLGYMRKKTYYVEIYSSGIGHFLPELRILAKEFDFENLASVSPVVDKISALVSEFSRFLKEHGVTHHYDADFFKVLIYVLRYKKLRQILIAISQKNILPRHLLDVAQDQDAEKLQALVADYSGESQRLDDFIFTSHRNMLNVIYTATGFDSFDVIFARVYAESARTIYTDTEKHLMEGIVESFLPLVCEGVLAIDCLQDPKYHCIAARNGGEIIVPYKVSSSIIDNYEFSLALLFDIPDYFHLIRPAAAKLGKPLASCTVEDLSTAIEAATSTSSYIFKDDVKSFLKALEEMSHYTIRGFQILDTFLNDRSLLAVAEAEEVAHAMSGGRPVVFDLVSKVSAMARKEVNLTPVRINNLELKDFNPELVLFKKLDLSNSLYSDFSFRTLLRILKLRIGETVSVELVRDDSAINPDNVSRFALLNELLIANFDINGGGTAFLDDHSVAEVPVGHKFVLPDEPKKEYSQIPDEMKLHDFVAELEILKMDELRSSFKNFSAESVIALLDKRIKEFSNNLPNSNIVSRMNQENLIRFIKLSGRIKRLFSINGGNTEILDAVLSSQVTLNEFEAKLAQKKFKAAEDASKAQAAAAKEKEDASKDLYAPGPYLQIPDKLHLHEYVEELEVFRHDELRSSYKNFLAEKVLSMMGRRTKEIFNELPNSNIALRMGKDNVVRFIKLHAKLTKLLAWNGGNTAILDTLIYSQGVFDNFEAKIAEKKMRKTEEPKVYKQIPEDMFLEEYAVELTELREFLGQQFCETNSDKVLSTLMEMLKTEQSGEKRLTLGKLYRNLVLLFKHNNDLTFVLDNVLLSTKVFKKFEEKLSDSAAADNKFVMSEFLEENAPESVEYHESEYVLSLLNNQTTPVDLNAEYIEAEASIKDAVSKALSTEENLVLEEDPEEYAAINNWTAQKIRETYKKKEPSVNVEASEVDKASLQDFLKKAKKDKDLKDERQFRAQKAYEWSKSMAESHRSLESRNFFNPIFSLSKYSEGVSMFPSIQNRRGAVEYLVLTLNGQTFVSEENPLGKKHSPEDMFTILERFSESDLEKYSKNIKKLQKKHWNLIGGGGNEKMLVLSRVQRSRTRRFLRTLKTVLATTGVVFISLLGLNIWLDDVQGDQVPLLALPPSENIAAVEEIVETPLKEVPTVQKELSLWQRLFWRR